MRQWLFHDLQRVQMDIVAAFLFGSSIRFDIIPHDVDLVIITNDESSGPSWERVMYYRDSLVQRFQKVFDVPLSAKVITPSEWREFDGVIVRERLSIF